MDAVLKELTPFVEQLVATEVQRILSGENEQHGAGFIQFPFVFADNGPIFASSFGGASTQDFQQQQGTSGVRVRKK